MWLRVFNSDRFWGEALLRQAFGKVIESGAPTIARDRRHPRVTCPRRHQALHDFGATVTVTDPKALDNARKPHPDLDYVEDPIAAAEDADLLLHLTEWPQFAHIDPNRLATRTTSPKVIDARGTLNTDQWRKAGWITRTLGCA
ncbi:UDP binding domain-containing protein [Streptomyces netropsis]